jgi:hypothetical protein
MTQFGFILKFAFVLVFFFASFLAKAQTVDCGVNANCSDPYCQFAANIEKGCNCFDGADNDGDGKADKADSNCAVYYGLVFVGEGSDCSIVPPGSNTPFDLVNAPITSSQNTSDTQSKISVGDVDGDGIPDAVITSKWNSEIRVVATADGQADGTRPGEVKSDFKSTGQGAKIFSGTGACAPKNLLFEHENLIADINGDGKAELFGVVSNRGGNPSTPPTCFFLVGFTYAPDNLVPMYNAIQIGTDRPGTFGIADMDGDGKAEIYLRDRIYAAETGALLATGNGNWDLDITAGPVAVDINGDDKMELVCGTKIYSIPSFANRNPAAPAALTLVADMNTISTVKAYVKLAIDPIEYGVDTHSMCSVADIDRDGNMDVVISGALNAVNGPTAVFYWNVAKGTVSYYIPTDPSYANGWPWGTGRVNLGDANGDGRTDLTFMAGAYLHCLTTDASGNLVPLWPAPRQINDSRSGVLTVSIYDFDNDGNPEIVYRDSQELVVVDGATGTQKLWSAVCQSHTYTEGPVIADVNGDGATDICVPCNTNNSFGINDPIQQQALGQFRLYYSSGNEWLPTRKVWNQPGYFVVNINDDLTLPFPQLDQALIFSNSPCPNGLPGPQMPMNVFLNQVPYLSADGCPVYPAPDLSFSGDNPDSPGVDENGDGIYTPAVEVIPPICGDLGISVRFNIINDGDLPITDIIPVSFFIGDPTDPAMSPDSLIHTTTLNIVNLAIDSIFTSPFISFNGTGGAFRLFIVLNNNGSVLPINPAGSVSNECRIDNNIYSVFIQPDPFITKVEKIRDNSKCLDTAPDNGELRVRIFKGVTEVTDYSQYGFQWYTGTSASYSPIAGATNYNLIGLTEGDYTAIVTNTAKGCVGLPVDTTIVRQGNDPEVIITVLSHQTLCNPQNGALQAQVTGGNLGYTFEWFDIALSPLGITGATASNLAAGNYIVRVSKDGCSKNSLPQTVDGPIVPDAQASTLVNVVDCLNPNSGSVTATALFNGIAQQPGNYEFKWYFYNADSSKRGSILPGIHGTAETRTGLPVGYYQVVITDIATQCQAIQAPVTEITNETVVPTAVITELRPQTSCDPANANGRLSAEVQVFGAPQNSASYTFQWFKGDNTLPANIHSNVSGINGSIAENVSGGGSFYTVKVTSVNHCSDTEKIIITEELNLPVVTLATIDNTICDPSLAASTYNGSVSASISFDSVAVTDLTNYAITWHSGSLNTDPVIAGQAAPLLSELNGGYYTVVVERTDLSCVSTPVSAEVKNTLVLPFIRTDSVASTNCTVNFNGNPVSNGQISVSDVDRGAPLTDYGFRWSDDGTTPTPVNDATSTILANLEGGYAYTVLVTNNLTGCANTHTINLPVNRIRPLIDVAKTSDNVNCDATLGSTGAVHAIVTYNGAQLNTPGVTALPPDYVITWSTGMNGDIVAGQPAGTYVASVVNESLGCTSDPDADVVLDAFLYPTIDIPVPVDQTSCDVTTPNGAIQATVTDGLGSVFVHTWYLGIGTGGTQLSTAGAQVDGSTTSLTDVASADYTFLTRNEATGCEAIQSRFIPNNITYPTFAFASVDPVTICGPAPNGAATPSVTGLSNLPDYNYTVFYAETFAGSTYPTDPAVIKASGIVFNYNNPAFAQPPVYSNLAPGYISALVIDNNTRCESNAVTAPVINATENYSILIDGKSNAGFCGGDGGGIEVTIQRSDNPGVACSTCTYEWYNATPVNPGPINFFNNPPDMGGAAMQTLVVAEDLGWPAAPPGVGAGTYTLVVVDNDPAHLACGNYFVETVNFAAAPVITVTETDVSKCLAPFDGEISVQVTGGSLVGYSVEIFPGNGPSGTPLTSIGLPPAAQAAPVNLAASMLEDGQYYIQVKDYEGVNENCPLGSIHKLVPLAFDPLITINQVIENTSCDPASFSDGEVELTANADPQQIAATDFAITALNPPPMGLIVPRDLPDDGTSSGLMAGFAPETYTFTVTDNNSGCFANAVVSIPDQPLMPTIFEAEAFDDSYCAPTSNGRIVVTQVGIGVAEPVTDYEFEWYSTADAAPANLLYLAAGGGATTGERYDETKSGWSSGSIPGAGNGNRQYFVRARRITGSGVGCFTPLVQKDVLDVHKTPNITLTTFDNTSCIVSDGEGVIRAATDVSADPLDANVLMGTYTYTWNPDPVAGNVSGGIGMANGQGIARIADFDVTALTAGPYAITSVNSVNGCAVTGTATIVTNPLPVTLLSYTKADQLICYPDGNIKVTEVAIDATGTATPAVYSFTDSTDPLTNLTDNFDFRWFSAANDGDTDPASYNTGVPIQSAGADITDDILTADNTATLQPYTAMAAGAYYVVAIRKSGMSPGAGCTTVPVRVNISDLHVNPLVSLTYEPNSSCDPVNPNGVIIATAYEKAGSTADTYSFTWTLNNGPLAPVTISSAPDNHTGRLDDAADGKYILIAKNISNTGCEIAASMDVLKDLNISMPNIIDVATTDPIDCYPTGSATVTRISIGGVTFYNTPPDNLDNTFDYKWYKTDYLPAAEIPGAVNHDLPAIDPGTYYVIVEDVRTACKSTPKEVVIAPDDIVYPAISITQTQLQISCPATFGTGRLVAIADGRDDSDPNYSFTWFNNLTATGAVIADSSTISGLIAGDYSVSVTNAATGCSAMDLYIISNESEDFYPELTLTTEPREHCLVNDGSMLAREVGWNPNSGYPFAPDYTTEIYSGANADISQPGMTMTNVSGFNRNWFIGNLDVGVYTVKITDNNTGCIITREEEVLDGRTSPVIAIVEDNPLINCDPARPNGQLSATADGGLVGGYQFSWYAGTSASGLIAGSNNKIIGQPMGAYTVRVTNNITGCFSDDLGNVTDGRLVPPSPDALLIFDRTNCDYPDGWVAANVGGITFNYSFDWYDGSALKPSPDFRGSNYRDRDIGLYTVTAIDQTTGCISLPVSVEVKDLRVIPEVMIHTMPSYCDELPGATGGNGTAEIELTPANIVTDQITWTEQPMNTVVGIGSYLTGVLPGFYQANVVTSQGCEASGVGEVKTEVFSYNLVSANGDRRNDNFMIDCISQFPNNNVKIFNRSGVLVYEANGYNNDEVVFKGIGENGVYTIGNELPVGTYFYIIDKRDGSKPKTGYLELVK